MVSETYLGDGLYVSLDAGVGAIKLRAPREGGDHVVYLEAETLDNFLIWLRAVREVSEEYASRATQ
jgi:hypothetical protein